MTTTRPWPRVQENTVLRRQDHHRCPSAEKGGLPVPLIPTFLMPNRRPFVACFLGWVGSLDPFPDSTMVVDLALPFSGQGGGPSATFFPGTGGPGVTFFAAVAVLPSSQLAEIIGRIPNRVQSPQPCTSTVSLCGST
jgi:hypothetical protein